MNAAFTSTDPLWTDVDTLARTLWGEARGEGITGMRAVAAVIGNRVADRRWPGTFREVCLQRWQFSCWLESDPNLAKLRAVDGRDPVFREAVWVAAEEVCGRLGDLTQGANHYHVDGMAKPPSWADASRWTVTIGHHRFYRL